jgi:hypothetical protein
MTRRDVDEDRVRSVTMAALLAVFVLTGPAVTYGAAAMPFLDVTCLGSAVDGQSTSMANGASNGGHAEAAVGGDDTSGAGSVAGGPAAEGDMTLAELRAQGGIDETSGAGSVADGPTSDSDQLLDDSRGNDGIDWENRDRGAAGEGDELCHGRGERFVESVDLHRRPR